MVTILYQFFGHSHVLNFGQIFFKFEHNLSYSIGLFAIENKQDRLELWSKIAYHILVWRPKKGSIYSLKSS